MNTKTMYNVNLFNQIEFLEKRGFEVFQIDIEQSRNSSNNKMTFYYK